MITPLNANRIVTLEGAQARINYSPRIRKWMEFPCQAQEILYLLALKQHILTVSIRNSLKTRDAA